MPRTRSAPRITALDLQQLFRPEPVQLVHQFNSLEFELPAAEPSYGCRPGKRPTGRQSNRPLRTNGNGAADPQPAAVRLQQIRELLAQRLSRQQIANRLGLDFYTVRNYIRRLRSAV